RALGVLRRMGPGHGRGLWHGGVMSRVGDRPADVLRLGALEAQVMDVLWDHGPATVRQVIEQLPSSPAYTTIATVLTNLDRKQLVTISRTKRSTRYAARLTRHEHAAQQM